MTTSRREMLQLARARMASAAALSLVDSARAQVAEEAESPSLEIVRKGRGMDVAKALSADAVAVGRPGWWALTLGGGGVARLMEYFQRELVNTVLHLGVDNIASLGRAHVQPIAATRPTELPQ